MIPTVVLVLALAGSVDSFFAGPVFPNPAFMSLLPKHSVLSAASALAAGPGRRKHLFSGGRDSKIATLSDGGCRSVWGLKAKAGDFDVQEIMPTNKVLQVNLDVLK